VTAVAVDHEALHLVEAAEPRHENASTQERPHPGKCAQVAVYAILAALRGRLPLERLLRCATVDVVERVRVAAASVPESIVYAGQVRCYRGTRPLPDVAELVVVVQGHDTVAFLAIEMRWWGFAREWIVSAIEFGWPPDTRDHRRRMHRVHAAHRRAVLDRQPVDVPGGGYVADLDDDLDRRMATWQRWDGLMATTTFTVTVVHRSDTPIRTAADALEGLRTDRAFGANCTKQTESLTGPALAYVLRQTGRDAVTCSATPSE